MFEFHKKVPLFDGPLGPGFGFLDKFLKKAPLDQTGTPTGDWKPSLLEDSFKNHNFNKFPKKAPLFKTFLPLLFRQFLCTDPKRIPLFGRPAPKSRVRPFCRQCQEGWADGTEKVQKKRYLFAISRRRRRCFTTPRRGSSRGLASTSQKLCLFPLFPKDGAT